jgi:surface protein
MKEKGITLIALVITIIVLLILAGVTVATLTGDNGLLTKAGQAKGAAEQSNLEEEVQLALVESETDKYFNPNSSIEDKLKSIFEKSYGQGNITVAKSGKNYKAIVKDTKTRYRIRYDGKVEKYEDMDPTNVYARLNDGTLYLRATQIDDRYKPYTNSYSIADNLNATVNDVLYVDIEEPIAPITASQMFYNCKNIVQINNMENFHTENVTTMSEMFCHMEKIDYIDVSRFDTSKVTSMSRMFDCCIKIDNLDLIGFNTSNVKAMNQMIYGCGLLKEIDVSGFSTGCVETMWGMFNGCSKVEILNVEVFDTSKVKNMGQMFNECHSLKNINVSNFNTSNVTDMNKMFRFCKALTAINLSSFNTDKTTNMYDLFSGCVNLKYIDLSNLFKINTGTNCNYILNSVNLNTLNIKCSQDTADKFKTLYPSLTDSNFEIVN